MVEGSRRVTLRNRKYLRKYTPFQCKPFVARPVLETGTPIGTPVEDILKNQRAPQLQPQHQPRRDPGSEETAVDHHDVQIQQAAGDGHAPHPALPGGQVAEQHVGDGHAPSPVTNAQVGATPVGGSPRQDQVLRSGSPGRDRRESLQLAPDDVIEQEPIGKSSEPRVRRSNRVNKGKMPKALEDFEVEL